ncbi:MAG TPA: N-acetyltransferase, partial [Sphingomonadales bacterium]|nr:N-acetyltransferase [Sphingomonadales bacterium]
MADPLRIHPVSGSAELKAFIRVPLSLYRNDPNWVPPLEFERKETLGPKNPYFLHGEAKYWIAFRGAETVGRISAQTDALVHQTIDPTLGHIGLFECADDQEAADALFRVAEGWLRAKGMARAQGPYNLSVNEECGVLVKGFDTPPMIMMGHALSYYQRLYERSGYKKAKDLYAYGLDITKGFSEKVQRFVDMGKRNPA